MLVVVPSVSVERAHAQSAEHARGEAATGLRWSDPRAWPGGRVPRQGSAVRIPKGRSIILDRNVRLSSLRVDGTLTFARRNLVLESDWVMVHGTLRIGTAKAPFRHRATIRLRDARRNENVMGMGDKVLGVMGGRLELYGARKRTSWTRLAATAPRGTRTIQLARTTTGWRRGDRIAIASTDFDHDQAETRTIRSIRRGVVTLDRPLDWTHHGTTQHIAGRTLDERAEVALLSRNVTIEGDATTDRTRFGAHVMAMGGARLTLDGVQLRRVGQAGRLLRYAIHLHMLGDGGRFVRIRNTSIHDSDNRCITVHGTNRATLAGNVCFDHHGHGIFLEDGAETRNTIAGNLVFATRAPDKEHRLLPSDAAPASFWITHPDNVVRGNVAGGSAGHGFWIALPEHPTGLYAKLHPQQAKRIWPRDTAIGSFRDNVAHSNNRDGLHFDNGPRPDGETETTHHRALRTPGDPRSTVLVTHLRGLRAWKNRGNGAWLRGGEHRLTGAVLADNGIGATLASDESMVQDSFIVGGSDNLGTPTDWERRIGAVGPGGRSLPRPWDQSYPTRGFAFYDGRVGVERTLFANFQPGATGSGATYDQGALGAELDNRFAISPRNFASQVSFVNARPVWLQTPEVGYDGSVSTVFLDADGSVTGTAGRSVSVRSPFLAGTGCEERADWNAQVCGGRYAGIRIGVGEGSGGALRPLTITRADGATQELRASGGAQSTRASGNLLLGTTYRLAFAGGTPPRVEVTLRDGQQHHLRVSFPRAEGFQVLRYGCKVADPKQWCAGHAASSAALDALPRSGYHYDDHGDADPTTGTMHLRLVALDSASETLEVTN